MPTPQEQPQDPLGRELKRQAFEDGYAKALAIFAHTYASTNDVTRAFNQANGAGAYRAKLYAGWSQMELDQESYERSMSR